MEHMKKYLTVPIYSGIGKCGELRIELSPVILDGIMDGTLSLSSMKGVSSKDLYFELESTFRNKQACDTTHPPASP